MEMVNEIKKLVDAKKEAFLHAGDLVWDCLLYTSPSPRD